MSRAIRLIFALCVIAMIALFAGRLITGAWTGAQWGMLAVAGLAGLLVFRRLVNIFTYSYGLSALLNGLLILIVLPGTASAVMASLAVVFGLRLLVFFRRRDRSASYATRRASQLRESRATPFAARLAIWFMMTWLLGFHLMAVWVVAAHATLSPGVFAGAAIMLAGIALEAVADRQKQRAKALVADRFVMTGLYARWRHPNFFGELLVQFGLIIAGLAAAAGIGEVLLVTIGPLYIALLMMSEARRVDREQQAVYGTDENFRAYRERSSSLLPRF